MKNINEESAEFREGFRRGSNYMGAIFVIATLVYLIVNLVGAII